MKEAYLTDGQLCKVLAELPDGKFLVKPIYEAPGFDPEDWTEIEGFPIVVDHVFEEAPLAKWHEAITNARIEKGKIQGQINEAKNELKEIHGQISAAKRDFELISRKHVDIAFFRNSDDYEYMVLFEKGNFVPKIVKKEEFASGAKSVSITQRVSRNWSKHEIHAWFKVDHDDNVIRDSTSFDMDWGVRYDVPEKEILAHAHEVFNRVYKEPIKTIGRHLLQKVKNNMKYVPASRHAEIEAAKKLLEANAIKNKREEIQKLQKQLDVLTKDQAQ